MSISNRRRCLTEGNRALQLFTNRDRLIRVFATYVNDDPASEKILYFHGDGGNGKSLLLKFLFKNYCKRLRSDIWQGLKPKPAARVAEYIVDVAQDWEFEPVPAVLHDFGLRRPSGAEQPQDPFYGLLMLRRNLSTEAKELGYCLRFPLYDFACVWYLYKTSKLSTEKLQELFPSEEIDFLVEIANAASETSWGSIGKAVLGLFSKHLGEKFILYLQKRRVKEEDVRDIREMDADRELIFELPRLLAQDLNAAMSQPKAPKRLVVFFDTHEAFWGVDERGILQGERYFAEDDWLRYLLSELELSSGVVAVVAGRELPKWDRANQHCIPQECIEAQLVYHLAPTDADKYLQKAGITNAALKQQIVEYACDAEGQVHPFLLGLCAEVVLQAKESTGDVTQQLEAPSQWLPTSDLTVSFDDKAKRLIDRLLSYADRKFAYAVHTLSACRAFNFSIYQYLAQKLHFDGTKPAFDTLTEFSFVWEMQQRGKNWYRIHDLVRQLDYRSNDEEIKTINQQAHAELEQYYRQLGEVAEAIYHANRLDWRRGVEEWVEEFDGALKQSRYDQCRSLLEVRSELIVQSDFQLGSVSLSEGDYFARLARYQEAKQEYLEAIAAYDRALALAPDHISVLNNKGNALAKLADLLSSLSQHEQAQQSYTQAIAAYDRSLALAPDDIGALNNKGLALESLADLLSSLSQHERAQQSYTEAIAAYDRALALAPDYIDALNNKGIALKRLADLLSRRSQHERAQHFYTQAIAAYDCALALAPDDINALNNKGNALQSLADLLSRRSQHERAQHFYTQAIAAYERVLALAPDYIGALNNKGLALQRLADLLSSLSQHERAQHFYTQAIAAYERALALAPDYIDILNNKGSALQSLGNLLQKLSQEEEALQNYQAALVAFNRSLAIAPNESIQNLRDQLQEFLATAEGDGDGEDTVP